MVYINRNVRNTEFNNIFNIGLLLDDLFDSDLRLKGSNLSEREKLYIYDELNAIIENDLLSYVIQFKRKYFMFSRYFFNRNKATIKKEIFHIIFNHILDNFYMINLSEKQQHKNIDTITTLFIKHFDNIFLIMRGL